jgi:hypothetical protein
VTSAAVASGIPFATISGDITLSTSPTMKARKAFMEALMQSHPDIRAAHAHERGVQAGMYDNTPTGKQLCSQDMRRLRKAGVKHTGCRKVRTKAETEQMEEKIIDILHTYHPQTVRQIFYQMTVHKLVEKTEAGYDKIGDILCSMRRGGRLDYDFIVDNTRGVAQPVTFNNVREPLTNIVDTYRKSLWNGIPCRCRCGWRRTPWLR